jgi:hypothetical protein
MANQRSLLILAATLIVQCWTPVNGLAEDRRPCSNATLRGNYVFSETGTVIDVGPVAVAGVFQADGKGNIVTTDTVGLNGEIVQESLNFTYQVNPDCTGSASSLPGQEPAHYNFAIINLGEQITGIHTDPGTTLIIKAKKQFGKHGDSDRQEW